MIELLTRLSERQPAGGAHQKLNAQPLFEFANRTADPGLRQTQSLRCGGKTAFPHHLHKQVEVIIVFPFRHLPPRNNRAIQN